MEPALVPIVPVMAAPRRLPVIGQRADPAQLFSTLTDRRVDAHRRVHCRHYDGCLQYAIDSNWQSFSCSRCPVRDELTLDERRNAAPAIFRAFIEIMGDE